MTFYGQWNCDEEIAKYFNKVEYAVEVGAAHGIAASNTLHFEQNGAKVLCIEPNPLLFNALRNCRQWTIQAACGASNSDNVPFRVVTLTNGDQSAISGLAPDQRLIDTHPILKQEEIKVNVRTLDLCLLDWQASLKETVELDFVSIDTEGTELDVLKGFDLDRWQPKLLVIEQNFFEEEGEDEIQKYLYNHNYIYDKRVGVNNFYVRTTNSNNTMQQTKEPDILEEESSSVSMDNSTRRSGSEFTRRTSKR